MKRATHITPHTANVFHSPLKLLYILERIFCKSELEGERNERKTHRLREDFEDGLGPSSSEGKEVLAQIINRHALHSVLMRCDSWISLEKQSKQR